MDTPNIIDNIKNIVKQKLENAEAGHDWFHVERVYKMAVNIAGTESNIDMSVIEYAALLHDIAEMLMWCFAPNEMLKIKHLQKI